MKTDYICNSNLANGDKLQTYIGRASKTRLSDTENLDNFQTTQIAGNDAHADVYISVIPWLSYISMRELFTCYSWSAVQSPQYDSKYKSSRILNNHDK